MKSRLIVPLLVLVIVLGACTRESPVPDEREETTETGTVSPSYRINAGYDAESGTVTGDMAVTLHNNTGRSLNRAFFNLWPEADEFSPGGLTIRQVAVDGEAAGYEVTDTALEVTGLSIPNGGMAEIAIDFIATVPDLKHRFGRSGGQVSLGNWFPVLAVHDARGWVSHPYFADGESFYSESGDFEVLFKADPSFKIAATGQQQGREEAEDGDMTHRFRAHDVRDFAIMLNKDFRTETREVSGTLVNIHFPVRYADYVDAVFAEAENSLPLFDELFGEYAWPDLDIVLVDYGEEFDGGMEYPQLVTVNMPSVEDDPAKLAQTVSHEIAHQWFYGMVGSDSYSEPWLDESFSQFASYEAVYGPDGFGWIESPGKDAPLLNAPASEFTDAGVYGDIVYDYGAKTLSDFRVLIGEQQFREVMHTYVDRFRFRNATTLDFLRVAEEVTGNDHKQFWTGHRIQIK